MQEEQHKFRFKKLKLKFFDIHCHAYEYSLNEIKTFLENKILIFSVSEDLESIEKNLKISKIFNIPIFVGFHPWNVEKISNSDLKKLYDIFNSDFEKIVGIGEIGLDKIFIKNLEKQKKIFIEQLKLAKEFNLPINVHSLNSIKEVLELILKFDIEKVNFHWIRYSSYLEEIRKLNYYCSFNINIKYQQNHKKALETLNIKNILVESDGPHKYRNIYMNSLDVIEVIKEISNHYKIKEEKVIKNLKKNLKNFIKL